MSRIAVSVRNGTARIALLEGDDLREYFLWNPELPDGVGDVHAGRITARVPAMGGSFVEIGGATGFLPDSAGAAGLTEGAYLTVSITRAAQSGKGPRLKATTEALAADRPILLRRGPGPLLDLACRFPEVPVAIDDYALMATLRPHLQGRIRHEEAAFDAVLEDEIATLLEPSVALPYGAIMHVTPTPALTAIDIDAGAATADATKKPQAQAALNRALLPAIARQIVLRNLSGVILIDFAGMKTKARASLSAPLAQALAADPLKPRFHGFSKLGLAEISRPRIRPPLHEAKQALF